MKINHSEAQRERQQALECKRCCQSLRGMKGLTAERETTRRKNKSGCILGTSMTSTSSVKQWIENVEREEDEKALKPIQKIANTIHKSIPVTIDYPSNHDNGKMPVFRP